jgi:hypothetical protein
LFHRQLKVAVAQSQAENARALVSQDENTASLGKKSSSGAQRGILSLASCQRPINKTSRKNPDQAKLESGVSLGEKPLPITARETQPDSGRQTDSLGVKQFEVKTCYPIGP